ncbi:hypothetical protein BDY24DRAFT_412573 [Mrakia frigida]|uniref:uncharacterized protein n=1 Tax=Mrakia frigida TaxID=29902 RepID=UPI003FCC0090
MAPSSSKPSTSSSSSSHPHAPITPLLPLSTPIQHSSDVWSSDLRTLFEKAKERFGDVSWEVGREGDEDGEDDEDDDFESVDGREHGQKERIWGHKAMIYARAPPAFQARYFPPIQPRANSPLGTLNPNVNLSSSSTYLSSSSLQIPSSSSSHHHHSSNGNGIPSSWSNNKRGLSQTPSQISLASNFSSTSTIRPPLRLRVGVTPQMFKAELEWLYTGEGMGEVVEWLNDREGRAPGGGGGGLGLGLGLEGEGGEWGRIEGPGGVGSKTERLRNDLVYMWRSKLYSDVKITLPLPSTRDPSAPLDTVSDDPSSSATTATFSTHKFILASRSPYFAQLLLNTGGFKSRSDLISRDGGEIELPSPPFTPASLHFCLGFMYAGTLSFSNRSFDLQTAFQIHRSATYLQLSSLRSEVEARIVHEFCDSLPLSSSTFTSPNPTIPSNHSTFNHSSTSLSSQTTQSHQPPSKLISRRVPRVWRFASSPDVAAKDLELRTREWIVLHWGDCWSREVGEVGKRERDSLVKDVLALLHPSAVVSFVRSIAAIRARVELDVRNGGAGGGAGSGLPATRGLKQSAWVDNLLGMVLEIEQRMKGVLGGKFGEVVKGREFEGLVEGRGFEREVLMKVVEDAVGGVGTVEGCKDGGRVYEALVGLLVQVQEETSEPTLAIGSDNRRLVESAAAETMKHIRRRWLQVREKGGFVGLPSYILKEISDGVDQPEEELLVAPLNNPAPTRAAPRLSSSVSRSRLANEDASSLRSTILTRNATKGSDQGKDSDSVSVASRMSTTSRASVASRSTTTSRASVASISSSVVAPLQSSLNHKPPLPRAPSFGGSSTTSSSSRTPVPTLSKSTSVAALNPPPPRSSAALTSRASTSSLASTSSRQSISSRTTPLSSSSSPSPATSTSSESGRKRTVTSSQTLPTSRPPSVASSVRSTASTLRKAPATTPSPSTPVPKLPAAKSPIPPRQRTTSAMSTTSTRSVAASTKSTAPPPQKTSTPPLPALPASPPAKVHRRPPAAASAMSRSPVKATPPPAPPLESSPASTPSTRKRVLSSASRISTKTSTPDLKSASAAAAATTPTGPKPLRRPSSVASIRSTTNGASPSSSSTKKAPPPPLPISTSTPNPTPTKPSPIVPTLNVPLAVVPRKPRSSSTASSQHPHSTPHTTPSRTNLDLPLTRSTPSAPSSPTTHNRPSRFHPAAAFDPPKRPPPVRKVPSVPAFVVHALGSSLPILPSPGVTLIVGIPCIISITGGSTKRGRCRAFARYIGQLQGEKGPWVGVELSSDAFGGTEADREVKGLNDGSFGGVRYFDIAGAGTEEWEEEGGRGTKMRKMSSSSKSEDGSGGGGLFGGMWGAAGKKRDAGESALGEGSDLNKRIRSHSPNSNGGGGGERTTRGLFLRPNAVVWVEGAD